MLTWLLVWMLCLCHGHAASACLRTTSSFFLNQPFFVIRLEFIWREPHPRSSFLFHSLLVLMLLSINSLDLHLVALRLNAWRRDKRQAHWRTKQCAGHRVRVGDEARYWGCWDFLSKWTRSNMRAILWLYFWLYIKYCHWWNQINNDGQL